MIYDCSPQTKERAPATLLLLSLPLSTRFDNKVVTVCRVDGSKERVRRGGRMWSKALNVG
jgi:hypothetical protein